MPSRWNLPAPTEAIVKSSPRARTRGSGFDNQKEPLPTGAIVPKTMVTESRKRILREITQYLKRTIKK